MNVLVIPADQQEAFAAGEEVSWVVEDERLQDAEHWTLDEDDGYFWPHGFDSNCSPISCHIPTGERVVVEDKLWVLDPVTTPLTLAKVSVEVMTLDDAAERLDPLGYGHLGWVDQFGRSHGVKDTSPGVHVWLVIAQKEEG